MYVVMTCIIGPICTRTERVNVFSIPPREKAYLHAKLQVQCILLLLLLNSLASSGIVITQYGSTVYIGMALVWPAI